MCSKTDLCNAQLLIKEERTFITSFTQTVYPNASCCAQFSLRPHWVEPVVSSGGFVPLIACHHTRDGCKNKYSCVELLRCFQTIDSYGVECVCWNAEHNPRGSAGRKRVHRTGTRAVFSQCHLLVLVIQTLPRAQVVSESGQTSPPDPTWGGKTDRNEGEPPRIVVSCPSHDFQPLLRLNFVHQEL